MQESQEGGSTQPTHPARFCWHYQHGFPTMEKGARVSAPSIPCFFFPLDQPSYFSLMMLPKCRSSPGLQGVPPASSGVCQWKLHSHLHLPQCDGGWWSCGSLGKNQTHSGLRSFFLFCPRRWNTQLIFALHKDYSHFPSIAKLILAVHSPVPSGSPASFISSLPYLRICPEFSGL